MNYEDVLDRSFPLKKASGRNHNANVGSEDISRIAEASRHPTSVDPERVDLDDEHEGNNDSAERPRDDNMGAGEDSMNLRYDKDLVDEISESLGVLTDENGQREFFSDVVSELNPEASINQIEEEMSDEGYSQDEINDGLETLEESHMISCGRLSQRGFAVAEFASDLHSYLSNLDDEIKNVKSEALESNVVEGIELQLDRNKFGRAAKNFDEESRLGRIGSLVSPFDRSGSRKDRDSNALMAFLAAAEENTRRGLGEVTGYASDHSASGKIGHLDGEGYLKASKDGSVQPTPVGEFLKESFDGLYEQFRDIRQDEQRLETRIGNSKDLMSYRVSGEYDSSREAANELEDIVAKIKDSENMDVESSRSLFRDNYDPMARAMADNYNEELGA